MTSYNVGLIVQVPNVGATNNQIEEWIQFKTGYRADIECSNPLCDHDLSSDWIEVELH